MSAQSAATDGDWAAAARPGRECSKISMAMLSLVSIQLIEFRSTSWPCFPRRLRGLLSLACPRESNQREGHPDGLPLFEGCPALLALLRAPNSRLQTAQSLRQEARFIA